MDAIVVTPCVFVKVGLFSGVSANRSLREVTNAWVFNQPITFPTDYVGNMDYMFSNAYSFNQPINFSSSSKLTSTNSMFYNAWSFNQPSDHGDRQCHHHVSNVLQCFELREYRELHFHLESDEYGQHVQLDCRLHPELGELGHLAGFLLQQFLSLLASLIALRVAMPLA